MSQFNLTPSAGGYEALFLFKREFLKSDRIINPLTTAVLSQPPSPITMTPFPFLLFLFSSPRELITFSFLLFCAGKQKILNHAIYNQNKINPKQSMWTLSGKGGNRKDSKG